MHTPRVLAVVAMLWGTSAVATGVPQGAAPAIRFEANRGQTDPAVRFLARGRGSTIFLTPTESVLSLEGGRAVHVRYVGGAPCASVQGVGELAGRSHYYRGSDAARWHTDVPSYASVRYDEIYPGIDLLYYGNEGRLEYDFVVAPGADPGSIRLAFDGAERLEIDADGALVLHVAGLPVRMERPVVYQPSAQGRMSVDGRWALDGERQAVFAIGEYDRSAPLVVDPVLGYSTFLGGSSFDAAADIAVDGQGNMVVTGWTGSANFPGAGSLDGIEVFVVKLDPSGSTPLFTTFLGGGLDERATALALDAAGNAYVTGYTNSHDFPTLDAAQSQLGLGSCMTKGGPVPCPDAFIAKLTAETGALDYSTFLGGAVADSGTGIDVDGAGSAYVIAVGGSGYPLTLSSYKAPQGNTFVSKLNPQGSSLVYSARLGYSITDLIFDGNLYGDIAVDGTGSAYVTGLTGDDAFPTMNPLQGALDGELDAFVTKLDPAGAALVYSTFLGGGGDDGGTAIAVDASGQALVAGSTSSTDFPTRFPQQDSYAGGGMDAFVAKLDGTGAALVYSTFLGGSGKEILQDIALDLSGNAHLCGVTDSIDYPAVNALQDAPVGFKDVFVTKLDAAGAVLAYSTTVGGSENEFWDGGDPQAMQDPSSGGIALDAAGRAYVAGATFSADFPVVDAFQATKGGPGLDAFVLRLEDAGPGRIASLTIGKSSREPGKLVLAWSPSCSSGAQNYGIYEGFLGRYYSHSSIVCREAEPALTEEITPGAGDRYYLVVPHSQALEGSYGTDSDGNERPAGASPCGALQDTTPCP